MRRNVKHVGTLCATLLSVAHCRSPLLQRGLVAPCLLGFSWPLVQSMDRGVACQGKARAVAAAVAVYSAADAARKRAAAAVAVTAAQHTPQRQQKQQKQQKQHKQAAQAASKRQSDDAAPGEKSARVGGKSGRPESASPSSSPCCSLPCLRLGRYVPRGIGCGSRRPGCRQAVDLAAAQVEQHLHLRGSTSCGPWRGR